MAEGKDVHNFLVDDADHFPSFYKLTPGQQANVDRVLHHIDHVLPVLVVVLEQRYEECDTDGHNNHRMMGVAIVIRD
jgi:hypothetical protein